ncbi:hypothetical protein QL285_093439 [Trifolium repens]|nr:hypothetical protein QL285_093439 [Trifolium repens]
MVAAIYDSVDRFGGGNLALMRRGQTFWTYIDTSKPRLCDVIFYKSLLFAINIFKKMVSFNFGCLNDHFDIRTITSDVGDLDVVGNKYLVKSLEEELWLVTGEWRWDISDFLYGGEELNEKGARREGRNTATKKKEYTARLNEEEVLFTN